MKLGTYKELMAFASSKFQASTANELKKFLTFIATHSYNEALSQNFALDIRPGNVTTKAPAKTRYEAHKKMWDLQIIFSGKEAIGVLPISNAGKPVINYDETKDIEFYGTVEELGGEIFILCLGNGIFLAPCDAHAPCLIAGTSDTHDKLVVKIPVTCEM